MGRERLLPELVSIVIPTRDEARHIEACLRSVLEQKLDWPIEVIVADGGSRDDTAARVQRRGVTTGENSQHGGD